jgi:hypothetical protein
MSAEHRSPVILIGVPFSRIPAAEPARGRPGESSVPCRRIHRHFGDVPLAARHPRNGVVIRAATVNLGGKVPMRSHHLRSLLFASLIVFVASASAQAPSAAPRWFKGNLHTHSLWSDGDDYPEMIADWYKQNGYHFLAISDHNIMQLGTKWFELKAPVSIAGNVNQRGGGKVLEKYLQRFGSDWVELRESAGKREVRLKPLDEYRSLLEEPGRFLMIHSEEISSNWKREKTATTPEQGGPVHINVTNPREFVPPAQGEDAVTVMNTVVDAVVAQREKTGQPMITHINHPNFRWAFTVEELMRVRNEKFFEVYNGHPGVNNDGDETHLSMDEMWDVMLTRRLTDLNLPVVYGVGVDDSHNYHDIRIGRSNTGRGWVMVRARQLTPESIIHAMEAGDFYSSNGVVLTDVKREGKRLSVTIQPEPGVTYTTRFIGTRKGYSTESELLPVPKDQQRTLPHRRYSKDIGAVLSEVTGTNASYTLRGDEIYVRAKVVSSKPKVNGSVANEVEMAWTQPLVPAAR